MPTYCFQNAAGETFEKSFPMGTAPKKIGPFTRIVSYPMLVTFKGGAEAGWNRAMLGFKENKVTWAEVETWCQQADEQADRTEKAKAKAAGDSALAYL